MRKKEDLFSKPDNPLPTIGWEVESPRKAFNTSLVGMYALFFDFMGLPRNRNHTRVVPGIPDTYRYASSFWKFSTAPSYSAAVAQRTLCELIKGGFIPHLEGSATALDIQNLLDGKLVSFHINLGIPSWLINKPREDPFYTQPDILLLASGFELAYTSAERLTHRSQSIIAVTKEAEKTNKNKDSGINLLRLELKAFEVGGANTYRLMEEIQLVAAASFSAMADYEIQLTEVWRMAKEKIQAVYDKYYIEPKLVANKQEISEKLRNNNIQRELRRILTDAAHMVRICRHVI